MVIESLQLYSVLPPILSASRSPLKTYRKFGYRLVCTPHAPKLISELLEFAIRMLTKTGSPIRCRGAVIPATNSVSILNVFPEISVLAFAKRASDVAVGSANAVAVITGVAVCVGIAVAGAWTIGISAMSVWIFDHRDETQTRFRAP